MNGTNLRVVFARNPPDAYSDCPHFPTLNPNFQCPFPGYTLEIIKMLADSLHWNLIPVIDDSPVGSADWGTHLANGSWTGMVSRLLNGTADTVCYSYQLTSTRFKDFEFSYPITNVQPIFVVKARNETVASVLWNAFKPFTWTVWGVFLASFILNLVAMILISKVEVIVRLREKFRPFEMLWDIVQIQLGERSENIMFYSLSGNFVLFAFALIQSGLMIDLYKAMLLTALLTSSGNNPFQDADEMIQLIAEKKYHMTTDYLSWYFDDLQNSNDSHFVKLRAAVKDNPVVNAGSVEKALDLVDTGRYVYPMQQDSLALQMSKERCGYVYVSQGMPQVSAYFIFPKNSSHLPQLNRQIIMNLVFIQRTFNKYFNQGYKLTKTPKCFSSSSNLESSSSTDSDGDGESDAEEGSSATTDSHKPLDLESVLGVFMIGALGITLSIAVFIFEVYHYWHMRVLERHMRMKDPWNVRHIVRIAQLHFSTKERYNNIDVMKLVEVLPEQK